jgi:magnesium-transporting ATPase (P-type)
MSIHKQESSSGEKSTLYLKGAPDVLLSKCSHYLNEMGEKRLIDEDFMKIYVSRYEGFGGNVSLFSFLYTLSSTGGACPWLCL